VRLTGTGESYRHTHRGTEPKHWDQQLETEVLHLSTKAHSHRLQRGQAGDLPQSSQSGRDSEPFLSPASVAGARRMKHNSGLKPVSAWSQAWVSSGEVLPKQEANAFASGDQAQGKFLDSGPGSLAVF
jgi:hypothetical protein